MPAAEAAHRPATGSGRTMRLWLGFLIIVAAAIGLAWFGAGSLRPEVSSTGLEFRTIKAGTGEPIGAQDAALLDYILTMDDGTVVDSSDKNGGAQPFSPSMPKLFPGFAEAMAKMQEGGQYRFTMPQSLAFPSGAPPGFPKGPLTFEVRVQKVVRGGAAILKQGGAAQQPPQQ
jgi:hypothetical protein